MRKKIQKSMMLILGVTFILFYAIISIFLYRRNLSLLEAEVRQEAIYISAAINISGSDYLEEMSQVDSQIRITLIGDNGEVLFDSGVNDSDVDEMDDFTND